MESESMPAASIRALLTRIIDYAGLYPPAKLDMAATARNYKSYGECSEAWILGRLVIPVARLEEFEHAAADLMPKRERDRPWVISAVAGPAGSPQFEADLEAIEAFNMRHDDADHGRAVIDVIETKADNASSINAVLDVLPDEYYGFFELPIDRDLSGAIDALAEGDAGAKVRTGGVAVDLYPSPKHLARFICACAAANVPFKATAGLHHPLRHRNSTMNVEEFGFLSVFLAACLAMTHELPESELVELLIEQSLDAFQFSDEGADWRDHRIETQSIEDVREEFALSFGSCSFEEPRDELRRLALL